MKALKKQEDCKGWRCISYDNCLKEWAYSFGEKCAIICEDEQISYVDLEKMTRNVANFFHNKGLRKGDRVIFQMPNTIEWVVSLLGLLRSGIIPVMVLPAHGRHEIRGICDIAEPKAYIYMNSFFHNGAKETAETISGEVSSISEMVSGEDIKKAMVSDSEEVFYDIPEYTDIAMLLLSGGTTGVPKMIPRTHGDYIYDNTMIAARLRLDREDVFLAVLPASHNFTLGNPGVLGTLMSGGSVVMLTDISPMEIYEEIEKHKVSFTSLVPAVLNMCINYRREDPSYDIGSLKFIMSGGAMLHGETEEDVKKVLGIEMVHIYGTAEGLNVCYEPKHKKEEDSGKQGTPISEDDEVEVIDESGNILGPDMPGELITRGPYTIKNYYKNPEADRESFTEDGFYKTGDLAVINSRGEITVLGRAVEQINRAGEKIMPAELENILKTNEHIEDCVVAGIPDKELGNRVVLFVKRNKRTLSKKEIHEHLENKGVATYKWPEIIMYVDNFPLTAVNKIDRKKLIKMI